MKKALCLLLTMVICISLVACAGQSSSPNNSTKVEENNSSVEKETELKVEMTTGQKNALKAAKSYLDFSGFSYDGLIKQLEFEKYSHEDAVFAADNCGADWNEQAVKSAKSYLSTSSFSKDGLIEQLEFDGFTKEQAAYGAKENGYE
ncbi:MAG: Ltp family lipoprotein [Eubacteriales bacterium]|nr:Ltp family lipoprotein [Eubacteriales bacterium]